MCLVIDISDWKITPRYLAKSFSIIMLESILVLQYGILKCFGLKRRHSVLLILTQNISLMHNSITEKTEVSSDDFIYTSGRV